MDLADIIQEQLEALQTLSDQLQETGIHAAVDDRLIEETKELVEKTQRNLSPGRATGFFTRSELFCSHNIPYLVCRI